ncbi:hypothetical protein HK101_002033, partial [Irineochytrium annulatum]
MGPDCEVTILNSPQDLAWARNDLSRIKLEHTSSLDTSSDPTLLTMLDNTSSPDNMKSEPMDLEYVDALVLPAKQESQMSIFNEDDFIMSSKSSSASFLSASNASVKSSPPAESTPVTAAPPKKKRNRKPKAPQQPVVNANPIGVAGPSTGAPSTTPDDKPIKVRKPRPPNAGPPKPRKSRAKPKINPNASVGPDGLALVHGHQVVAPFTFSHDLPTPLAPPTVDGLQPLVARILHPIRSASNYPRTYAPGVTMSKATDHVLFKIDLQTLLDECDLVVAETERDVLDVQPAARDVVVGQGTASEFPHYANVVGGREAVTKRVLPGGVLEEVGDGMDGIEVLALDKNSRKRTREEDELEVEDLKRRMLTHNQQSINDIMECVFGVEVSDLFGDYGKTIPTPPVSSKPAPRIWNANSPIILYKKQPPKTTCTQTEGEMLKPTATASNTTSTSSNARLESRTNSSAPL